MSSHMCICLLHVIVCIVSHIVTISAQAPIIQTANGPLEGYRESVLQKDLEIFLGIPFAKPPVGNLRFRRPEPNDNWSETLRAVRYQSSCFQVLDETFGNFHGSQMWNPNTEMSEDCLYLNIWVPKVQSTVGLATLVWIYGGSFTTGTSSLDVYDGRYLAARNNVIVASMNYRLGPLGFLYTGNERAPGNMGLLDQTMAIKWLHDNIESFGGNKTKITIFGESAGAASVAFHLLSPLSRTYFNNAIMQSGSTLAPWAYASAEASFGFTKRFAEKLDCLSDNIDFVMDCLNSSDATVITENYIFTVAPADREKISSVVKPTLDNYFLEDSPAKLFERGRVKNTNILAGVNKNEMSYFLPYQFTRYFSLQNNQPLTRNDFLNALEGMIPMKNRYELDAIVQEYELSVMQSERKTYRMILEDIGGDFRFKCPMIDLTKEYARIFPDTSERYFYSFEHRLSNNPWPEWMGVMHGYEIELVFGLPFRDTGNYTDAERALSADIMQFWANFAKTGNPNKETEYDQRSNLWPTYDANSQEYIILKTGSTFHTGTGIKHSECSFWNDFYPELGKIGNKEVCVSSSENVCPGLTKLSAILLSVIILVVCYGR